MASFSERHGYKEVRAVIQRDDLDDETRLALWNTIAPLLEIFAKYRGDFYSQDDTTESGTIAALWVDDFQMARDERKSPSMVWGLVKQRILHGGWNEAMDVIESVAQKIEANKTQRTTKLSGYLVGALNGCFEKYLVAYRFIGLEITPVDTSVEADAIASAVADSSPVAGALHALERAVKLLADRTSPDYPNSIKESISAVEAVVKKLTGEGTLGAGLKKLEDAGLHIHPALREAWSKMYGWTSNEDGIRHAGIEAASVDQALAKYALVTCSAFVSYLIEEGRKVGLLS